MYPHRLDMNLVTEERGLWDLINRTEDSQQFVFDDSLYTVAKIIPLDHVEGIQNKPFWCLWRLGNKGSPSTNERLQNKVFKLESVTVVVERTMSIRGRDVVLGRGGTVIILIPSPLQM